MKTIRIIIQVLIAIIPMFVNTMMVATRNPRTIMLLCIYTIILNIYLIVQFGHYAEKFGDWFNSKLK
jgi:hypothetical protein